MRGRNKQPVPSKVDLEEKLDKTIEFLSWVQEFSKKIVTIFFIIFIIANLYILGMITVNFYLTREIYFLDNFMAEVYQTFREVIGGYLLKAAFENIVKIAVSAITAYIEYKKELLHKDCADECEAEDLEIEEE